MKKRKTNINTDWIKQLELEFYSKTTDKLNQNCSKHRLKSIVDRFNFRVVSEQKSVLFGRTIRAKTIKNISTMEDLYYYFIKRYLIRISRLKFKKRSIYVSIQGKYKNCDLVLLSPESLFGLTIYSTFDEVYSFVFSTKFMLKDFVDYVANLYLKNEKSNNETVIDLIKNDIRKVKKI